MLVKVKTGVRRVLVMELWRGPDRTCPHRCEHLGKSCNLENKADPHAGPKPPSEEALLPFRLGAVEINPEGGELLWQANEAEAKVVAKAIVADEADEEWDLFD